MPILHKFINKYRFHNIFSIFYNYGFVFKTKQFYFGKFLLYL